MTNLKRSMALVCIGSLNCFPVVNAATANYICTVENESQLASNGKLKPAGAVYKGQQFSVDRATGSMDGGVVNRSYSEKMVIDPGGQSQSFKLLSLSAEVLTTDRGKNALYLSVQENAESVEKPFLLVDGSRILTGLCQ